MIHEVMHNEDRVLDNLQPEQDDSETVTGDSDGLQDNDSLKRSQVQV